MIFLAIFDSIIVGAPYVVPFERYSFSFSWVILSAWPKIRGPHDEIQSMNSFPSTS